MTAGDPMNLYEARVYVNASQQARYGDYYWYEDGLVFEFQLIESDLVEICIDKEGEVHSARIQIKGKLPACTRIYPSEGWEELFQPRTSSAKMIEAEEIRASVPIVKEGNQLVAYPPDATK